VIDKEDKPCTNAGLFLLQNDLHESPRLETKKLTLAEIDTAFMETNGRISFILKDKNAE